MRKRHSYVNLEGKRVFVYSVLWRVMDMVGFLINWIEVWKGVLVHQAICVKKVPVR